MSKEGVSMTKYKKGDIVTGCVTGVEKYGIFVSLDDYNSGLIHISEISESFVRNPLDYVRVGETINAVVIEDEDEDSFQVKLSIKNLDYRFNKKRKQKIIETKAGFATLESQLNNWIKEKQSAIERKNEKK